jgi:tetratricopeptide (TPR) repeat protein
MGGAQVAIVDDATAVFWNPAGLSLIEHRELSLMHVSLYEETAYDFAAAAWPILDVGTIGVAGIRLGSQNIEFRDRYGPLGEHDYSTGQYWLSYGRSVYRALSGGVNLKVVNENLGGYSATTASMDAGLLWRAGPTFSVGLNAQDIVSGDLKLFREEEKIPYNIKCGVGMQWRNDTGTHGFAVEVDADKTKDQPVEMHLGGEAMVAEYLFARAGYDRRGGTFGAGVRYGFAAVDYAYKGNGTLGGSHRLSLMLFFGPATSDQRAKRIERARDLEASRLDATRLAYADELSRTASQMFERNELDTAMVLCNQALGYDPDLEEARDLLRRIRDRLDERAAEEIDAKSRERARENMVSSRVAAGLDLLEQGELDEARVEFNAALKLDADNATAKDGLARIGAETDTLVQTYRADGDVMFAARDYGEAIVAWNRALELKPDQDDIRRKVAEAKRLMTLNQKLRDAIEAYSYGDLELARRVFREVLNIDGDNRTALEYIDIMDRKDVPVVPLDELKADQEYWEKYVEGLALFRNKRYQDAIDVWQSVLDKYPGSRETRANMEQARLRMEQ